MKKQFVTLVVLSVLSLFISSYVFAAKTLTFATWLSPSDPHNSVVIPTWASWVKEATNGSVEVKVEYYVGNPKDLFNAVEDGTYAGGWSYHGYIPGRFVLTKVIELPSLSVSNAEKASEAYWQIHQKYLSKGNEHAGLELIGLFVHGPGHIMMKTPIASLDELKGKKIRVGGGIQGNIAKNLGVVAVPAPGSKVYEILQTGVADGVFMPLNQLKGMNLSEVVTEVYELPQGMYLGSFGIFLNPDFLDSLSPQEKKAVLSVSGERLSKLAGKVWGENDKDGVKQGKEAGVKFVKASDEDVQKFNILQKEFDTEWLEEAKKYKDIDAPKVLSELKTILSE